MIKPTLTLLQATDVTGQKQYRLRNVRADSTVGELITGLVPRMKLPDVDTEGRPLAYQALLSREGRHLHASEVVGEALMPEDTLVLQPNIDAGASPA